MSEPRPWWVRLCLMPKTTRRMARNQIILLFLLVAICLCNTCIELASESALGKLAVVLGLSVTVLGTILIALVWMAIRWVDSRGQWG
jgi:hypothetical protein